MRNLKAQLTMEQAKRFAVASLTKAVEKMDYNAKNIEVMLVHFKDGEVQTEYVNDEEVNKLCDEIREEDADAFAEHVDDEDDGSDE